MSDRDIDTSSENVLSDWARAARGEGEPGADVPGPEEPEEDDEGLVDEEGVPAWGTTTAASASVADGTTAEGEEPAEQGAEPEAASFEPAAGGRAEPTSEGAEPAPSEEIAPTDFESEVPADAGDEPALFAVELSHEHAAGDLDIPDGYAVLEGAPEGGRRAVGVVVARFNGEVTTRLLERALEELETAGVRQEAITVMVVPGAFELPIAATALAKTRRFACIVALGCVIRGDTPHFDYVASEAASGLQLAALETGVPVSFGVLTLDRVEQAEPRIEKGAEAVRSALEMADLFSHLRAAASR
jgi:6,7-dimethyl-8-ribityllumazine synthase